MSKRKKNDQRINNIVYQLRKVREEKNLSYAQITEIIETNGDYVSKSSLSKVFGEQPPEEQAYDYEYTIRPIAKALLDIETIEDDDNTDIQAMKSLLKYKIEKIQDLEQQIEQLHIAIDKEKLHASEKFSAEKKLLNDRIDFLSSQVELKDKRMDYLLNAVHEKDKILLEKDAKMDALIEKIINCPCRKRYEEEK